MSELYLTILSAYLCTEVSNELKTELSEEQLKKLQKVFSEVTFKLVVEMSKKNQENKLFNTNNN